MMNYYIVCQEDKNKEIQMVLQWTVFQQDGNHTDNFVFDKQFYFLLKKSVG